MATTTLGSKSVGSIVKLKESGVLVDFYVAKHDYESGLNGAGRTLLVRKDCYDNRQWNSYYVSTYNSSDIDNWLNLDYKRKFETSVQAAMGNTTFYYTPGGGKTAVTTLKRSVFLLSMTELGQFQEGVNTEGSTLSIYSTLQIAYLNGSVNTQWTRTPNVRLYYNAFYLTASRGSAYGGFENKHGSRPAFTLPASLPVSDDGYIITNTAPTTPESINIPGNIQGGTSITVSWGTSSDAESNLEGYVVERSVDGGSKWTQIYQGSARSTTNTVPFGTDTVMYRVRAYDSQGLYSSYKNSNQVAVVNNNAPGTPASITVPGSVLGGAALTVTWGAASDSDGNLSGYALERQVDGGAWSEIHRGNALSFTDTITKGWATVAYRVRAYDTLSAYSDYAVSPTRTINNNTAPTITSVSANGSDLGTKGGGFAVSYSVSDADADTVTVTETIDGITKRTFTATLEGSNSFAVTGETFMQLLNGKHTLNITANDGQASSTHTLTFIKEVTEASITLEEPISADAPITICVLSAIGFVPTDAHYTVEVTNNALDNAPVWEDCTAEVKNGANHIFTNKTADKGAAFNFRITAERGSSGEGGYITSVQGGFQ